MKKIIIFLNFILFINIQCQEFEYYPLNIDFNGIVVIKDKVICYGSSSAYLVSNDNGLNWSQRTIYGKNYNIEENINKIVNFNDTLWGVTNLGKIIKSIDYGETWENFQTSQLISNSEIDVNKDYIYYKTDGKIVFYDRNIKVLRELKHSYLLNNKSKNNTFSIFGNYLTYFNSDSLKFYTYDLKNDKEFIFDLIDTNICKKCGSISFSNTGKDILIAVENSLYTFENYLKSYSKKFLPKNTIIGKFYNKNDSLLSVYANSTTSDKYINYQTNFLNSSLDLIKISNEEMYYLINPNTIKEIVKLNDNSFIGVGNNKSIIVSEKNSNNWILKSYCSNFSQYFSKLIKQDKIYLYNINGESLFSSNGGITFHPIIKSENNSFYRGLSSVNKSNYFDSAGIVIKIGIPEILGYNNVIFSKDYGKTFAPKSLNILGYTDFISNIVRVNDYFLLANNFIYSGKYYRSLYTFNSNFDFMKNYTVSDYASNGSSLIRYIESQDSNKIFGIVEDEMDAIARYKIGFSYDYGKTWDVKAFFKSDYSFVSAQPLGNDSILILTRDKNCNDKSCNASAFIYDRLNSKVTNLINRNGENYLNRIFKHNDNYYAFASGMSYIYDSNGKIISQDSTYYINVTDYDYGNKYFIGYVVDIKNGIRTICKITPKIDKFNDIIIDENPNSYFYSAPPFPTPSRNEVKSLIFWDGSSDIDTDEISIYDIFGNKIDDKSNIKINKLNSYSGYLTWDCSKATSGVYMIQLKHGNKTNNISVMVVR